MKNTVINEPSKLETLQEKLKQAKCRYVYGKNVVEQNKANFDMMILLNKIRKLKGCNF